MDWRRDDEPRRATGFVGLGVSYYFMPANVHLSGSVGPALVALVHDRYRYDRSRDYDYYDYDDYGRRNEYYDGVGASLAFGKEWWVHDNWGVGMEATLLYSHGAGWLDPIVWKELHTTAVTLGISATYN